VDDAKMVRGDGIEALIKCKINGSIVKHGFDCKVNIYMPNGDRCKKSSLNSKGPFHEQVIAKLDALTSK